MNSYLGVTFAIVVALFFLTVKVDQVVFGNRARKRDIKAMIRYDRRLR